MGVKLNQATVKDRQFKVTTTFGHFLSSQKNSAHRQGTLCDPPEPSKHNLGKITLQQRANRTCNQRFTVRHFKSTTGILSWTYTSSTGSQEFCTSQENLQNYMADTLCCIERELQMLFAPPEYQKGNTARAPVKTDTYLGSCPAGMQLGFIHGEAMIGKFKQKFFFQLFINH